MKRIHMWVHNHYEAVRFYLAMITAGIVIVVLIGNTQKLQESIDLNRATTNQRADQVKKVIDELKADNSQQTQLIACLLAIHGQTSKISGEDAAKCEENAAKQINNQTFSLKSTNPPIPIPSSPSNNSSSNTPQEPSNPPDRGIMNGLGNVIDRALDWINESP